MIVFGMLSKWAEEPNKNGVYQYLAKLPPESLLKTAEQANRI